jgi:threonine aldolase
MVATLAASVTPTDRDKAVPRLEEKVAGILGKPAAAMFPTGALAQQLALRLHADRRDLRNVVFHPTCHLELHEHHGYSIVHGLTAILAGHPDALITLADLETITEPVAALLLELPQREIGGPLPSWDQLATQIGWAGDRGAATHLDGARLWEAQPYYGRPHAEIAGLFDTVYVSLYKGLGAPSGAVLAGQEDFIEEARLWRNRIGGDTARAWADALLALHGLDVHLPRMAEFWERAKRLSVGLNRIEGLRVVPAVPMTALFHIHLDAPVDAVRAQREPLAEETGLLMQGWVWEPSGGGSSVEVTIAANFDVIEDDEVVSLFAMVIERARG